MGENYIMSLSYPIPEFISPPLLKRMVHAGRFGRKTGKGWYKYDNKGEKIGVLKYEKLNHQNSNR